jgi:NAD dependent epimerase/dehydratase
MMSSTSLTDHIEIDRTNWQGQRVLVTGAGGFIGSHLVETLVAAGAKVRAFTRYNSRSDPGLLNLLPVEMLKSVELIFGDLRDPAAILTAMVGTSHVFHLGALIAIPYSYLHPVDVVETNVIGTLNVLMAARGARVVRVIHTSTSEVYGTALRVPIDEEHPLRGQSPYSASKIGADKLVESFYRSFDIPVVTLRPFNTYGPRQSTRAVIPTIITQALEGETIHLGNLDARRDMTYVSDTVNGFLKVASTPGIEGETFNLGTGAEVSIRELVGVIGSLLGKTLAVTVEASRLRPEKSEVRRLLANNWRARERLNWEPQVSLQDGLDMTITWVANHLNLFRPDRYHI